MAHISAFSGLPITLTDFDFNKSGKLLVAPQPLPHAKNDNYKKLFI